jgi:hypothetical protein
MFFKSKEPQLNLLELVPHRLAKHDVEDDGIVVVKVKRFKYDWMAVAFLPKWKSHYIHTRLDSFGSHVWTACDGQRSVLEIAESLRGEFGEEIEPVHDRLKLFLQMLINRGFVAMHYADGSPVRK